MLVFGVLVPFSFGFGVEGLDFGCCFLDGVTGCFRISSLSAKSNLALASLSGVIPVSGSCGPKSMEIVTPLFFRVL